MHNKALIPLIPIRAPTTARLSTNQQNKLHHVPTIHSLGLRVHLTQRAPVDVHVRASAQVVEAVRALDLEELVAARLQVLGAGVDLVDGELLLVADEWVGVLIEDCQGCQLLFDLKVTWMGLRSVRLCSWANSMISALRASSSGRAEVRLMKRMARERKARRALWKIILIGQGRYVLCE